MAPTIEHDVREFGLWWLPDNREKQVPGILTYTPTEGARLELIGMLRGPFDLVFGPEPQQLTDQDLDRTGDYGRICGVAGGKAFTLEGCFRTGASNMLAPQAGGSTEWVHVNRFVRGAELEPDEHVDTTRVDVRLLHLPYWIAEGGVAEKHYFPEKVPEGEANITLEAHLLPDRVIKLDNGMTLSLCEQVTVVGDRVTERGLRRDFNVRLEGELSELEEYLRVITTFQDLVSVGTDRTSTFEEFKFHHPDIVHERSDREPFSVPIDFYAQWSNWETRQPKTLHPHQLLFSLADLGGDDAIRRWCALALDHRGTVARLMATRYRSGGYVSDKLLNRAAALEALDRDTHDQDDIHFRERMLRLGALAGDPFTKAIGDVDRWAKRLKNARVAAAHHSNRHPAEAGRLDYYLAETAYYLFVLCFLRHIEANDNAFDRIAKDDGFLRAARELRQTD